MTPLNSTIDLWTGAEVCKYKSRTGYSAGCRCDKCREAERCHLRQKKILIRQIYDQIRDSQCCFDCGYDKIPKILEFHHLTDSDKDDNPRKKNTIVKMVRELKKGVFLCPTCHTVRHLDPVTGLVTTRNSNLR